jgi:hypothetical protein
MIVEFVEKFVAENHIEPEADPAAGGMDDADAFANPLSESAPEPADDDAPQRPAQTGSTLPREAEEPAVPGATFDVEEGGFADGGGGGGGGDRRRGRFGRRRAEEDAAPREVEFAPAGGDVRAGPPPGVAAPAAAAASAWTSPAQPWSFVGPYSIEEFNPDLYSREEMQTIRTLLSQYEREGLTFSVIAQYNVSCPRRMAEDRRRREVFRQQQMEAQARRAAAAAEAADAEEGGGEEAEPEPEAC